MTFVRKLVSTLLLVFFPFSILVSASTETGLVWLNSQSDSNNLYAIDSKIATPLQSYSEILTTLKFNGQSIPPILIEKINTDDYNSTEHLSRKISANLQDDLNASVLINQLLTYQNIDGGFGEFAGYESTIVDTAYALKALAYADVSATTLQKAMLYLAYFQQSNGSWHDGANEESTYLTALAMQSLWSVRQKYKLDNQLTLAKAFLESKKVNNIWYEIHQSAQVLIALAPMYESNVSLSSTIQTLYAMQQSNGSWENDPYTTALVLRALTNAKKPVPNPDLGSLSGKIIDIDSHISIPDALITLSYMEGSQTINAKSDGSFEYSALSEGNYTLNVTANGYNTLHSTFTLEQGEAKELGDLFLVQAPGALGVTLHGVVIDQRTNQTIQGAKISYGDQSIVTDESGHYVLRSDETGLHSVIVNKEGFLTENLTLDFKSGTSYEYSPVLRSSDVKVITGNPYALLFGVVKDTNTSEPIEGVQVLLSGNTTFIVNTDAEGRYNYEPLNSGALNLTLMKSGYKPLSLSLNVNEGEAIEFSPYMEQTEVPEVKGIKGVVYDSIANAPLADAVVRVDINDSYFRSIATDVDGYFELQNIDAEQIRLTYSMDGYKTLSYGISMSADYITGSTSVIDLGQVRLRPISADIILPDLVAMDMNISNLASDPQTLISEGSLSFKIKNVGTLPSSKSFKTMAFFDADNDGVFSEANDTMVGMVDVNMTLQIEESGTVTIPIKGKLPFKDAYLTVLIDSNRDVIEIDENNNNILSTEAYNTVKKDLRQSKPAVKWRWNTPTNYVGFYSTPIVVPLEDTNEDGRIDDRDIASIVVVYSYKSGLDGTLVALSGKDGHELWKVERGAYAISNGLVAGDIDNDGYVEIIARKINYGTPDYGASSLVAYEHDGRIKWQTEPGTFSYYYTDYDGGTISDLEGDGSPEIIYCGHVFDNQGNIKWSYPVDRYYSPIAVADINLDGFKEVLTDSGAYSSSGELLWAIDKFSLLWSQSRSISIANFDNDEFPELLYYGGGVIYMLNHDGSIVWGPLKSMANRQPPYIAGTGSIVNVDYDERPEIITSNVALKADGSLLWDNWTSGQYYENHGMSPDSFEKYTLAYDFDGDSRAEVFSFSPEEMSLLNGQSGVEVVSMPSSGFGLFKYPIVVDIDHDQSAEIVTTDYKDGNPSVVVWEEANKGWTGTESIWASRDYHVSEINKDGTIPKLEEPSWLTHNTYRTNPAYSPLKADATLSLLKLYDNGLGEPYSVGIRVGNGGNRTFAEDLNVTIYDGDPENGGVLLGNLMTGRLTPNTYVDLKLDGVQQITNTMIYVVVDGANVIQEYDETNNYMHIPFVAMNFLGNVTAGVSKDFIKSNENVIFSATVVNEGSMSTNFDVEFILKDQVDNAVASFSRHNTNELESNASLTITEHWNSGITLAGTYLIETILRDVNDKVIDVDKKEFRIINSDSEGPVYSLIGLETRTDKNTYHTTDTIEVHSSVRNHSTNTIIEDAVLAVEVMAPDGSLYATSTIEIGTLTPNALRELFAGIAYVNAPQGAYTVVTKVLNGSGELLTSDSDTIVISENKAMTLVGEVRVAYPTLERGEMQACNATLRNEGGSDLAALQVRQLLVHADTQSESGVQNETIDLAKGMTHDIRYVFNTSPMKEGEYFCILQAQIDGVWTNLDHKAYTLTEPPVKLNVTMGAGSKGRLLVLLDEGEYEPFGPDEVTLLSQQRAYLEGVLEDNGYAYTIVTDASAFEHAFRTGSYNGYVVFSEEPKLSEQLQREMAEAVFRGESLLIGGKHDQRNGRLDALVGAEYKGKTQETGSIDMNDTFYDLFLNDDKLTIDTRESEILATFVSGESAVVAKERYKGKTIFSAFDVLLYAAYSGGQYESLLLQLLEQMQGEAFAHEVGTTLPVTLSIENLGVPVKGESVTLHYGADAEIIDPGAGYLDSDGALHWNYSLLDNNMTSLSFWLRPKEAGDLTLESSIYYERNGETSLYNQYTKTFTIDAAATLEALIGAVALEDSRVYKQVLGFLEKMQQARSEGNIGQAIDFALKAADELDAIGTEEADTLHYRLAGVIKALGMQTQTK